MTLEYYEEKAHLAQEDFGDKLRNLSSNLATIVTEKANKAASEMLDEAEFRVQEFLSQMSPRRIVQDNPLASIGGAFVVGFVMTSKFNTDEENQKATATVKHPLLTAIAQLGIDVIRVFAVSQINQRYASNIQSTSNVPKYH